MSDDESDVSSEVTWTTSDSAIVDLDPTSPDAPLEVTGIGTATLTAAIGAISTTLTVEVLAATTEPTVGTTAWVVTAPAGGSRMALSHRASASGRAWRGWHRVRRVRAAGRARVLVA